MWFGRNSGDYGLVRPHPFPGSFSSLSCDHIIYYCCGGLSPAGDWSTLLQWSRSECQARCAKYCHFTPLSAHTSILLQPTTQLFIDGKFIDSKTDKWINNYNPVSDRLTQGLYSIAQFVPRLGEGSLLLCDLICTECFPIRMRGIVIVLEIFFLSSCPQATQEVLTRVPCTTQDEMLSAVDAAKRAFSTWKETSVMSRQRVMFNLQHLIRENMVCGCSLLQCFT